MGNRIQALLLATVLLLATILQSHAGKVILNIRASNPAGWKQTVSVKSYLPSAIQPADIMNLDGLDLAYDVQRAAYYVHKETALGPRDETLYAVELKDIWRIDEDTLVFLKQHAEFLSSLFRRTGNKKKAVELREQLLRRLAQIQRRQTESDISRATIENHINAYNENLTLLREAKKEIVELENMALSVIRDPITLFRDPEPTHVRQRTVPSNEQDYGEVTIRISVRNPSSTEPRNISIKRYLPAEIQKDDVIRSGDMAVRTDNEKGICFLYKKTLLSG